MGNKKEIAAFWQGGACGAISSIVFNAWIVPFATEFSKKLGAGPEDAAVAFIDWLSATFGYEFLARPEVAFPLGFYWVAYTAIQVAFAVIGIAVGLTIREVFLRALSSRSA